MNDIVEVTDVVVDAYAFELRVGDRVRLVFADDTWATVERVEPPDGPQYREGDRIEALTPPTVMLRLDSGETVACVAEFLRTPVWRWHVNEVRR